MHSSISGPLVLVNCVLRQQRVDSAREYSKGKTYAILLVIMDVLRHVIYLNIVISVMCYECNACDNDSGND
jgi:hypothetical protein